MDILLAFIFGAVIGLLAHYTVGHRDTRGVALAPILGALIAGIAWTALTWAGVGTDSPWPWLAAIVLPAVVVWPTIVVLGRRRVAHDRSERARLKIS